MPPYQVRLSDIRSDIPETQSFECDSYETAIQVGLELGSASLMELWDGNRLVAILNLSNQAAGTG